MHEFAITQSILSIALEQAEAARAAKITVINVIVGELSGVVDECVKFYFEFLSKDTIAAGAALSFDRPSTRLRCRRCDTTFPPDSNKWVCPDCGEQSVEIISGRECRVESIEVE